MENRIHYISFLSLWTKICAFGLFYIFVHVTVVLPVMEFQGMEVHIAENIGDRETETLELKELIEHRINISLPPLIAQDNALFSRVLNTIIKRYQNLFTPPPEYV